MLFQLNDLPDKWLKIKRQAVSTKQQIGPIQAYQVDIIQKRIVLLGNRVNTYRTKFLKKKVSLNQIKEIFIE